MFRGMFLFAASYIALVVVHVHFLLCVNCDTNNQNQQQQLLHKNSCGDINNISFPFRLKSNPLDNCGYPYMGLECENNRTILYLFSGKYYVQAINYSSQVISVVDVGIQRNSCSSLPLHSLSRHNFSLEVDPYDAYLNEFAVFVSCEKPVKYPLYIDTSSNISTPASCEIKGEGVSSSSGKKHSYVLVGSYYSLNWSDVEDLCSVDMVFPTRRRTSQLPDGSFVERNITSLLEVHNALADGFDLSWRFYDYKLCILQALCFSNYDQNATVGACSGRPYGILAFLGGKLNCQ